MSREPRIACISVPALPLQLVLRAHPEWRRDPLVVVEDDRPLAEILWANAAAEKERVGRGMRFNQAQAIVSRLRAAVVSKIEIDAAVEELLKLLTAFSPRVEPAREWPGVFWIDASGMQRLFNGLREWARAVREAVAASGFTASIAVGFRRYAVFAVARTRAGAVVLDSDDEESRSARDAELAHLGVASKLVREMDVLGVRTLGDFLRLPASGLRSRYGEEAFRLHELSSGAAFEPLAPRLAAENLRVDFDIDPPESGRARLLFFFQSAFSEIADELAKRAEAITAFEITLGLERVRDAHRERIETAAPTLNVAQILELIELKLSALTLAAPVERASIEVESVRVRPEQLELLRGTARRNLEAASRALARIKAAFGAASVMHARLLPRHLPEASFGWEPASEVRLPVPRIMPRELPLVRLLHATPVPLPQIPTHEPEAWLGAHGAVTAMHGPYRTSGGWWHKRVERDYFYVETRTGEILWVFYDKPRRRWFLHGVVD